MPSASYGIASAARNVACGAGQEILVLEDQFPSHVYAWRRLAAESSGSVRTITRAEALSTNGVVDWTAALIEAISDQTAAVAVPNCLWTDGSLVDVAAVGAKARAHGAALVLDLTQSAGALPFDVAAVDPDFVVAATYKWLLGPYSLGLLYALCGAAPSRRTAA